MPVQIEFFTAAVGTRLGGPLANTPARAVVVGQTKLIDYPNGRELYELGVDGVEIDNRVADSPEVAALLSALLPPLKSVGDGDRNDEPQLSFEEHERLKALGYIN